MENADSGQGNQLGVIDQFMYIVDLSNRIQRIEGWLTPIESLVLYTIALNTNGNIVEIGSWKGKSTCALGQGAKDGNKGAKVYAIDHFTGSAEHQQNGAVNTFGDFISNIGNFGVSEHITIMPISSMKAVDEWKNNGSKPINLLFIDGSHKYDEVLADFKKWSQFVPVGGVIAFHDARDWDGPKAVVHSYIVGKDGWKCFFVDNMCVAEKLK